MTEQTDVKVKLVVNSNSKAATDKLKSDLQQTNRVAKQHSGSLSGSLVSGYSATTQMIGNLYTKVVEKAIHTGKEIFTAPIEAFMESQKQVKALAGTFAMLDQGGNSMVALKMFASQTKDELEEMGMKIGVSDDALVSVFNNVIERGGKSVDQAKALTEQMAQAGRIVPGGAEQVSEAFENIQMGVIRARNPIVGMVAATGLLKGNAKHVAAEMSKMSPEKAMALGEKAIAKMAEKMKNAPMTMGEAITSMKVMGENLLETMGEPMTKALSKAVVGIRGLFFTPKGDATALTKMLTDGFQQAGDFLANAFAAVLPFVDGFVSGFTAFFAQTKQIWGEITKDSLISWQDIKAIAGFVGKALGMAVNGLVAGVGGLWLVTQKMIKHLLIGIGMFMQGLAASAEIAAKIQVAMGQKEAAKELRAAARGMKEAGAQTRLFGTKAERGGVLDKAKQTEGGDEATLRAQFMASVTDSNVKNNQIYIEEFNNAMAERRAMEANVQIADSALKMGNAQGYLAAFSVASKQQDKAAMKNIANFLQNNAYMAIAIGELAPDIIEGGVASFTKALRDAGKTELADLIDERQKGKLDIPNGAGPINMNGGQTFNIKQDFRDQDPDRVAVIFRKDLARVAASRIQAQPGRGIGGGAFTG